MEFPGPPDDKKKKKICTEYIIEVLLNPLLRRCDYFGYTGDAEESICPEVENLVIRREKYIQ